MIVNSGGQVSGSGECSRGNHVSRLLHRVSGLRLWMPAHPKPAATPQPQPLPTCLVLQTVRSSFWLWSRFSLWVAPREKSQVLRTV